MTNPDEITAIQEQLAHTTRAAEDLSDVVAAQAKEIAMLKRQVGALMDRASSDTSEGSVTLGDQRPPHY